MPGLQGRTVEGGQAGSSRHSWRLQPHWELTAGQHFFPEGRSGEESSTCLLPSGSGLGSLSRAPSAWLGSGSHLLGLSLAGKWGCGPRGAPSQAPRALFWDSRGSHIRADLPYPHVSLALSAQGSPSPGLGLPKGTQCHSLGKPDVELAPGGSVHPCSQEVALWLSEMGPRPSLTSFSPQAS